MNNPDSNYIYADLTEQIISCVYKVYNTLGSGFLEKIYENALLIELKECGLDSTGQFPVKVYYKGIIIGEYVADIIVENKIILELKAVVKLSKIHEVQLVNYLKATGIQVGLLINFGEEKVEIKRRVLTINKKNDA